MKAERRRGEVERDRKSLDEKSAELGGERVSARRDEVWARLRSRFCRDSCSEVFEGDVDEGIFASSSASMAGEFRPIPEIWLRLLAFGQPLRQGTLRADEYAMARLFSTGKETIV